MLPDMLLLVQIYNLYRQFMARRVGVRKYRRLPITWMKRMFVKRREQSQYFHLHRYLQDGSPGHTYEFLNYMRMDIVLFNKILTAITPAIERQDTRLRTSVSPGERLALRFMADVTSYPSLQSAFLVSRHTIGKIVPEVCDAIVAAFGHVISCPETPAQWKSVAERFGERWNFYHCVGAIDGKHCRIRMPASNGPDFFNYKKFYSIILLAIIDADYKFMFVDVGAEGKASDGGVFADSVLQRGFDTNVIGLPEPEPYPGDDVDTPYFLLGDNAFALKPYMMTPYPHDPNPTTEHHFNYRHSRCRRVVECAFEILTAR